MQTIEARAILSAADKTGGIFSTIANKVRGMNAAARQANQTMVSTSRMASMSQRAAAASAAANSAVLGAGARVLGPAALAVGGAKAFKNFAQADLQVTRIGITADASKEQIAGLQKQLRDLGTSTGQSFKDVAGGMESLVSGGMDLKDSLKAMPSIARTAQAAGAEVKDMATTTLALNQNLGISSDKMQTAFDILVKGGKEGKFELKDMARYFPSIAPAAVAAGEKGEEGLMRIVAAMQTIRQGTGTTEEAAASMQNIFAKMESEETAKKFKKMGVDLGEGFKKARKEGKPLIEAFVEMTKQATKGDLSLLPKLISDMEFARGMRALLSFPELYSKVMGSVRQTAGATAGDLKKVLDTPAMSIQRMSNAWDNMSASLGHFLEKSIGVAANLEKISNVLKLWESGGMKGANDRAQEYQDSLAKQGEASALDARIANLEKTIKGKDPLFGAPPDRAKLQQELMDIRVKKFEAEDAARFRSIEGPLIPASELPSADDLKAFNEMRDERRREENRGLRAVKKLSDATAPMPAGDPRHFANQPIAPGAIKVEPQSLEVKTEVHGDVKGETTVTVKVEPSSEFLRVVNEAKAVAKMAGQIRGNGVGSTGRSSPDAAPSLGGMGVP